MEQVNSILNAAASLLLHPLRDLNPWAGMAAISLVEAALMLLLFKVFSNQRALRRAKNRMMGRLLEMVLFQDVVVTLGSLGRLLAADAAYLARMIPPMAAAALPVSLLLVQVSAWFGARPLRAGETAVVAARLRPDLPVMEQTLAVRASGGLIVETDSVRAPALNEVGWRIRCSGEEPAWVEVLVNGVASRKLVAAGAGLVPISDLRPRPGLWSEIGHPVEKRLPPEGPLVGLEIRHPRREFPVGGMRLHWLSAHIGLVLLLGAALMKPFRVVL
ncbi:MAG: hypothetical protein FJ224_10105 [Lentisphaerae bacterium]|nr:hypothetical protein [Lentisphaerota bacterium]